jgi:hypothetical protein
VQTSTKEIVVEVTTESNQQAAGCATDSVDRTLNRLFKPGLMFNGRAVRARAGILNFMIGVAIALILTNPASDAAWIAAAVLLFDMIAAVTFGLTPWSPTGVLGTLLTAKIEPTRTPHLPKRFAWSLGASLSPTCLILSLLHVHEAWIVGVFSIFFVLTWLDAALGFCVGCWIYSRLFGCQSCTIGNP